MQVTWTTLKQFIQAGNPYQYIDGGELASYIIWSSDGYLTLYCDLYHDEQTERSTDQADWEDNFKSAATTLPARQSPFAEKTVGGKSLFNRTEGKEFSVSVGDNDLIYTISWPTVKFTGIEIINGEVGDVVNLKVLDSTTGTYTTVPNYQLNQFGFTVNLPDGFYKRESRYDADLYYGMQIKIELNTATARDVRINYVIHEVK